eukprot:scaffold67107_cov14-Tisochrysis_lutea.AAC.1
MLVVQPQGRKVWVGLIWTWFRPAGSGVHLNQKGGVFAPESGKTYQQNGFAQSMTGKKKQPLSPQLCTTKLTCTGSNQDPPKKLCDARTTWKRRVEMQ